MLIIIYCSSCTSVPFSAAMRDEHDLNDEDVKQLQYYISNKIVLHRAMTQEEYERIKESTPWYTWKKVRGKYVEEIIIRSKTPCIAIGTTNDALKISFEKGKYITFIPRDGGKFYLAGDWTNSTVRNFSGDIGWALLASGAVGLVVDIIGNIGYEAIAPVDYSSPEYLDAPLTAAEIVLTVGAWISLLTAASSVLFFILDIPYKDVTASMQYNGKEYKIVSSNADSVHLLVDEDTLE